MSIATASSSRFAWSYSKLKNYETCPRRYAEIELKKSVEEQKSMELQRGDDLHAAMYSAINGGVPLPTTFIYMQDWVKRLSGGLNGDPDRVGIIRTEEKLSVDRNYKPTGFFDKATWLRGRVDYIRIIESERNPALDIGHIVDFKTGKQKDDDTQLALMAFLAFCWHRRLAKVRCDFLWTEYNDTSHQTFLREDVPNIISEILPRVKAMQDAHACGEFVPRPCGLCKDYCPVTTCEHWGKRPPRRMEYE